MGDIRCELPPKAELSYLPKFIEIGLCVLWWPRDRSRVRVYKRERNPGQDRPTERKEIKKVMGGGERKIERESGKEKSSE